MFNSVRIRLTLWYVGVLSLVLIGFSFAVYTLLAREARSDLDRELAGAIDVLSRSLRHEIAEHEGKLPGEQSFISQVLDTVYQDSFPGMSIAVYDAANLIAAKPGAASVVPARPQSADLTVEYSRMQLDGEPQRIAAQAVDTEVGRYVFVAESSLLPVETELAKLRRIFYLSIPLALAATALGGFLLARKSLAPVVEMSEAADRISSKDLSQRIAVGNPQDELGKLAATLNKLLARLERSFALQRQFMEDSSHELRTPVYVAHTAAQVMLEHDGRSEAEYREALITIDQQMKRLHNLVEDLFVLARADSGTYPLRIAGFDLGETVDEAVRAAKLLGQRKGVTVTGPELRELPSQGDESLTRQLLMILLDNAVKYTPRAGRVAVEIGLDDPKFYSIVVSDTGPGIAASDQKHVFDRFYRTDKARSGASGGSGLGLAIAKWIAEVHGGTLSLTKTDGDGSCFAATIPRSA